MAHRDPQTGQFVASDDDHYDDIEVATFDVDAGVEAANLGGGTGFNSGTNDEADGIELLDYDEIVDRNEELVLLSAAHRLVAYINSTETADGTVKVGAEISASPSGAIELLTASAALPGDDNVVGQNERDDSIDLIGRPLVAVAHAPFSDGATGVGGAGTAGDDTTTLHRPPAEMARFHPRDELFANVSIETWNVDDAGVHSQITGQHVYGVISDD